MQRYRDANTTAQRPNFSAIFYNQHPVGALGYPCKTLLSQYASEAEIYGALDRHCQKAHGNGLALPFFCFGNPGVFHCDDIYFVSE